MRRRLEESDRLDIRSYQRGLIAIVGNSRLSILEIFISRDIDKKIMKH